jgi:hypothetical protein
MNNIKKQFEDAGKKLLEQQKLNRHLSISFEDVISDMNITKEQKEKAYMLFGNVSEEDGKVIWENDRIKCFQLYQKLEGMEIILKMEDK